MSDVGTVEPETCAACCRMSEPTERNPNQVVASLVHAAVARRIATNDNPDEHVRAAERLAWIEQFLETSGSPEGLPSSEGDVLGTARRGCRWIQNRWRRTWRMPPRIGLVGPNNQKGLGSLNRDLMKWLPIADWLTPESLAATAESLSIRERRRIHGFLSRLDVLLFAETPFLDWLPRQARAFGVRVVCVPNWEWLHPGLRWLHDVDVMICPTWRAQATLTEWRERFGFRWELRCCPWPIDVEAIPFRQREVCRRFVFVNGTDRRHPQRHDGSETAVRRKGIEWLIAAARRLPHVPFTVWTQTDESLAVSGNVECRGSVTMNADLYRDGDVCVQLSRWEGIGLPLLECQAAGMPLITVDEAPMNEHNPFMVVPVADRELLELWPRRWIAAPCVNPDDVVATLANCFGQDISQASRASRDFVEREHSWHQVRSQLLEWIIGEAVPVGRKS